MVSKKRKEEFIDYLGKLSNLKKFTRSDVTSLILYLRDRFYSREKYPGKNWIDEIFESHLRLLSLLSKLRLSHVFYSMLLELVIWNLRFIIIPGEMYLEQGNYSFLSRRIILAGSKGKLGHLFRGFLKVGNSSKTFPPFLP